MAVKIHEFLPVTLRTSEWLASRSGSVFLVEETLVLKQLDAVEKQYRCCRESNLDVAVVQPKTFGSHLGYRDCILFEFYPYYTCQIFTQIILAKVYPDYLCQNLPTLSMPNFT
jgi:hypothetical protein